MSGSLELRIMEERVFICVSRDGMRKGEGRVVSIFSRGFMNGDFVLTKIKNGELFATCGLLSLFLFSKSCNYCKILQLQT